MLIEIKHPKLTIMCRTERDGKRVALVELERDLPADEYGHISTQSVAFWCSLAPDQRGAMTAVPSVWGTALYGEGVLAPDYIPAYCGMSQEELLTLVGECWSRGTGFYHYLVVAG